MGVRYSIATNEKGFVSVWAFEKRHSGLYSVAP